MLYQLSYTPPKYIVKNKDWCGKKRGQPRSNSNSGKKSGPFYQVYRIEDDRGPYRCVGQDSAVSLRVPSFVVKSDDTLRRCYLPNLRPARWSKLLRSVRTHSLTHLLLIYLIVSSMLLNSKGDLPRRAIRYSCSTTLLVIKSLRKNGKTLVCTVTLSSATGGLLHRKVDRSNVS